MARFCMECGRPLPAGSGLPLLPIIPALLILGLLVGLIALISILLPRTVGSGTGGRRAEPQPGRGMVSSPSPSPTSTPAYMPITAENASRLRQIGWLKLASKGGDRWLPSGDWRVWAEISGSRIYVHQLGGSEATLIEAPDILSAVAVAPDGSRIAAGVVGDRLMLWVSADRLMLWDAADGEVLMDQEIPIHIPGAGHAGVYPPIWSRWIRSLAFSPGGRYLAACCPESSGTEGNMETIWIYDARAGVLLGALDAQVLDFAWGSEDQLLLIYRARPSFGGPASLVALRVPSMSVEPLLEGMPLERLIVAPDSSRIAAFLDRQRIQIFSLPAVRPGPLIEVPGPIASREDVSAAFTPDGRLLITESNGTLRFWRTDDGRRVHLIDGAGRLIGVSPDGLWIATENYEAPKIWAVPAGSSP